MIRPIDTVVKLQTQKGKSDNDKLKLTMKQVCEINEIKIYRNVLIGMKIL